MNICVVELIRVLFFFLLPLIVRYSDFVLDFLLILRVIRLFKIIGNIAR